MFFPLNYSRITGQPSACITHLITLLPSQKEEKLIQQTGSAATTTTTTTYPVYSHQVGSGEGKCMQSILHATTSEVRQRLSLTDPRLKIKQSRKEIVKGQEIIGITTLNNNINKTHQVIRQMITPRTNTSTIATGTGNKTKTSYLLTVTHLPTILLP